MSSQKDELLRGYTEFEASLISLIDELSVSGRKSQRHYEKLQRVHDKAIAFLAMLGNEDRSLQGNIRSSRINPDGKISFLFFGLMRHGRRHIAF